MEQVIETLVKKAGEAKNAPEAFQYAEAALSAAKALEELRRIRQSGR